MKKFSFGVAFLLIGLMIATGADAQRATYKVSNPYVNLTGAYSQPPQYVTTNATGPQIFPWYTATDTVTVNRKSYKDTFRCKLTGEHESVYTWCVAPTATGTGANVYTLWASADSSTGVAWVSVYTVSTTSVTPTPQASYQFHNGSGGWIYTNWMWTLNVGAGDSVLWYSGVNIR